MGDYRKNLYASYVSKFKRFEAGHLATSKASAWQYFDRKYFRYLHHLAPHEPVLEVGCGPGELLAYLVGKGFSGTEGIDVSQEQIEIARSRGLHVQCADVFAFLDQKPETYQAIIAIDFIEHFTKEEALSLLELMFRALKEDGVLLLQTPNGQGLFASQVIYADLTHCTIFTPGSLAQALRLAGFGEIVFSETGPVPKNWKGCVRLLLWSGIKLAANFVRLVEAGKRQQVWTENLICACRKRAGAQHVNESAGPRP